MISYIRLQYLLDGERRKPNNFKLERILKSRMRSVWSSLSSNYYTRMTSAHEQSIQVVI